MAAEERAEYLWGRSIFRSFAAMFRPDGLFRDHLCDIDIDRWPEIYFSRE